jgi:hypothetical protein
MIARVLRRKATTMRVAILRRRHAWVGMMGSVEGGRGVESWAETCGYKTRQNRHLGASGVGPASTSEDAHRCNAHLHAEDGGLELAPLAPSLKHARL